MSSHHFVKEGQEPALVILNALSFESVESFLEWSPLVVAHEQVLESVLSWGIKIDVVLAAPSNVATLTSTLQHQAPIRIFALEDSSDVSSVLWMLISMKQSSAYVCTDDVSVFFGQTDLPLDQIQLNLVNDGWKWSFIPSGKFMKWLSKGASLKIHSLNDVTITNLEREGDAAVVCEDGHVSIAGAGPIWVAESIQ